MSLTKVSFSMIQGNVFNVLDYGAVGDGIASDSAAINAAILDANVKGGGVVFFPVGVYKLNAQILLKPGVSLIGEQKGEWGAGVTPGVEFSKEFATGSVFFSPNTQTIAAVSYENFWIEGNKGGVGGSNGSGFEIQLCHDVIFRRVWVKECPSSGFVIGQGGSSYHNYLYNCYAYFNGASGYIVQSDWMRFIDCWADGNYIGIEFPATNSGAFAHIERCHFEEWELAAVAIRGNPTIGTNGNNKITNSRFFSRPYLNTWPAHGIFLDATSAGGGCSQNEISNNFFAYQSTYGPTKTGRIGIYFFGNNGGSNIVSGNVIGNFGSGIVVTSNVNLNALNNNQIDNCDIGINNGGTNTFVNGNIFTSNTTDFTGNGAAAKITENSFSVVPTLEANAFTSMNNSGSFGAWTPTLKFGGASTGITYSYRSGRFEKNGKTVTAYISIILSAVGSATGTATFDLPVAASNNQSVGTLWLPAGSSGITTATFGYVNPPDNQFYLVQGTTTFLTNSNFTNSTQLVATFVYESA